MNLKLFTLKFSSDLDGFDDTAMRQFLADKEVSSIHQHAFEIDGKPYWAILVKFSNAKSMAGESASSTEDCCGGAAEKDRSATASERRNGGDSQRIENLTAEQRQLFEALRSWRLKRSRDAQVPVYLICNNKELAAIACAKPMNINDLTSLKGVKASLVKDYGAEIVELCRQN